MDKSIRDICGLIVICLQIIISTGQQSCVLDDIQSTPGSCMPIRQCRYAVGQLYAGAQVKRCPKSGKDAVCCPSQPTLSQKKCNEWLEVLKSPEVFSQPASLQPQCAYKGTAELIVGGRDAHEFEFTYAVGLGYGNNPNSLDYSCGATLISDSWLITAAHCVTNKKGKPRWAVIGDITLKETTSIYRKKVPIVEWITHPNYSPPLIYNDVALLKLGQRLEINRYVLPACVGDPVITPKEGGTVQAIGWGQLGTFESQATRLQAVDLSIIGSKKCNSYFEGEADKSFRYPQGFLKSQLCAGDSTQGDGLQKDTCNGDSGGGIVVNPEHRCLYHVVGVTSIGSKYCGYGEPGVYSKIAAYVDWIERTVWA